MARAKKSVKKPTPARKKSAKKTAAPGKSAKKSAARKPAAAAAVALSADQRRRLLKPRTNSEDIIEQAVALWASRREIRVPGLTAARLSSQLARAKRAGTREQAVRTQLERRLRPLQDARLVADDAAYRGLLDLHAAVKLVGRSNPAVLEEFAFLGEHLTGVREEPEPGPGENENPPRP